MPIVTHARTFFRASRQLRVSASSFDWFPGLSVSCDWPVKLLWFWFYDTQLKTSLSSIKVTPQSLT